MEINPLSGSILDGRQQLRPDVTTSIPALTKPSPTSKTAKPVAIKNTATKVADTAAAKPVVAVLPIKLMRQAIEEESDENGWAHLGAVGSYLTKIRPDFDPRLYGHAKLSNLFKKNPQFFLLEERALAGTSSKVFYVKLV